MWAARLFVSPLPSTTPAVNSDDAPYGGTAHNLSYFFDFRGPGISATARSLSEK